MNLIQFQRIKKTYRLKKIENDFLRLIPTAYKKAWDGKFVDLITNGTLPADAIKQRNNIKGRIKKKLLKIQGPYCIYCGLHFDVVGTAQREHIADKAKYPEFTFTNKNLALSCAYCNGFEKKTTKNVVTHKSATYKNCQFSIVHPYFDDVEDHIEMAFDGANILLSEKNNSAKGKKTIQIFKLMELAQAALRGAAYMRQTQLQNLNRSGVALSSTIAVNKYTF